MDKIEILLAIEKVKQALEYVNKEGTHEQSARLLHALLQLYETLYRIEYESFINKKRSA